MKHYRRALLSALLLFVMVFVGALPASVSAETATSYCRDKYPDNSSSAAASYRISCRKGYALRGQSQAKVNTACGYDSSQPTANEVVRVCIIAAGKTPPDSSGGGVPATPQTSGGVDVDSQTFSTGLPQADAGSSQIQNILAIVFAVVAALSVLMIVSAGLRFVTAQGNAQEVAKARGTIGYAIAGLLIAITAEAIVALVASKL